MDISREAQTLRGCATECCDLAHQFHQRQSNISDSGDFSK
jgi:hypothetical protein